MQTALDLCMVWSLYGPRMCKHFWPASSPARMNLVLAEQSSGHGNPTKRSYPRRKSANSVGHQLGSCYLRTGMLPMLTGPCTVASLPGEHLFQASALPRNRMRPATNSCLWQFTSFSGVAGNSALRFCLPLKWRAIRPRATELLAQLQVDSLSQQRMVMQTWSQSPRSFARRADRLAEAEPDPSPCTPCPQRLSPPLFVPWSQVAKLRGVVAIHKDIACPCV